MYYQPDFDDGNIELNPTKTSIFIREPETIFERPSNRDEHFANREYFALLWALCYIVQKPVINRPNLMGWKNSYDSLASHLKLLKFKHSSILELVMRDIEDNKSEIHIQNEVTNQIGIINTDEVHPAWFEKKSEHYFRYTMAPHHKYLIHICVGHRYETILNDFSYDVEGGEHKKLIKAVSQQLARSGIYFYALVLTIHDDELILVKVLDKPPFSWINGIEDRINERLLMELT